MHDYHAYIHFSFVSKESVRLSYRQMNLKAKQSDRYRHQAGMQTGRQTDRHTHTTVRVKRVEYG